MPIMAQIGMLATGLAATATGAGDGATVCEIGAGVVTGVCAGEVAADGDSCGVEITCGFDGTAEGAADVSFPSCPGAFVSFGFRHMMSIPLKKIGRILRRAGRYPQRERNYSTCHIR